MRIAIVGAGFTGLGMGIRLRQAGIEDFATGGCGSWYLAADGGSSVVWPGYTWQFRRALRTFDPQSYELRTPAPQPAGSALAA